MFLLQTSKKNEYIFLHLQIFFVTNPFALIDEERQSQSIVLSLVTSVLYEFFIFLIFYLNLFNLRCSLIFDDISNLFLSNFK